MDLAHLLPATRKLALLPAAERLALMPAHRWIGYTRAGRALARLEEMLAREPGRVRPRNLLVVGPSNNGKTAIAERLERAHPRHGSADGEHQVIPVLLVQVPPSPTLNRLYVAILDGLGVPGAMAMHSGRTAPLLEGLALRLLRRVGCRMLMLDELHNLLAAPTQRQRELLNLLRYLGNELRIPLACLGTREAYLAIRSDDQLENRFEPFLLPSWEDGREFGRLLASFEAVLPLREPSGLGTPAMRALVLRRSEGTIGEVAALLSAAADAAFRSGEERIVPETIEAADYQPPSVRRRMFERAAVMRGHPRHGGRRWPLHPQPGKWEGLENYVRRLAEAYEVSYDIFLRCALGHAGPGARDLHEVPDELLARLSAGTGVPTRRLRGMVGWSVMARLSRQARDWLGTPEGREAIKELRATIIRRQRRMPASREP